MSDEQLNTDLEEDDDLNLDDDGQGQEQEVELFMQVDDEQESSGVPVNTHVAMKRKLKGKLRDSDEELQALRAENEQLKAKPVQIIDTPKRPKMDDFDTDEEYDVALEKFETDRAQSLFDNVQKTEQQKSAGRKFQERVAASVDSHFDRAAVLVEKHSISPEVYQQATETVRGAMGDIHPGLKTFDVFVDLIGEGSEKTVFAIGRNKTKLAMLKETLHDDKSGLKAAFFLGQETARLNGVKARTSNAPAPGTKVTGDEQGTVKESKLKRDYEKAHKARNGQQAYNIKQQARKQGIVVKDW